MTNNLFHRGHEERTHSSLHSGRNYFAALAVTGTLLLGGCARTKQTIRQTELPQQAQEQTERMCPISVDMDTTHYTRVGPYLFDLARLGRIKGKPHAIFQIADMTGIFMVRFTIAEGETFQIKLDGRNLKVKVDSLFGVDTVPSPTSNGSSSNPSTQILNIGLEIVDVPGQQQPQPQSGARLTVSLPCHE